MQEHGMYKQDEPEVSWNQMSDRIRGVLGRFSLGGGGGMISWIFIGVFAVGLLIWAASGFFTVQPGEEAALRRFGKFVTGSK